MKAEAGRRVRGNAPRHMSSTASSTSQQARFSPFLAAAL